MEITETTKPGEKSAPEGGRELLPFVPKENARMTEDEQRRFEKKVRVYFHDAVMKVRGKQWDLSLADVERAMKISTDLGWKEAAAFAQSLRDIIMQRRSSNTREASAKVAQERFDKRKSARLQRVTAERTRLEVLQQGNQDRVREFASLVKTSKKIDIASLASALDLDEPSARARAAAMASQFGFKVDGPVILFEKGDKAGFIKSLIP